MKSKIVIGPLTVNLLIVVVLVVVLFLLNGCQTKPELRELAETYYNLGNAYIELEQWEKAETAYARSLEIEPDMYRAEYNLAKVHIYSGNYSDAERVLEKLLEKDPENIIFLETLAWSKLHRGLTQQAEVMYRSLLERDPANCNVRYNLALLLVDREEYAEAYSILLECVHFDNADAEVLLEIGLIEQKLEWGSGAAWFEKAAEKKPQNEKILTELAAALKEEEDFTEALDVYRRLSRNAEENNGAKFLFEQARLLLEKLEETEEAYTALTSALEEGFSDTDRLSDLYMYVEERENFDLLYDLEDLLRQFELIEAVTERAEQKKQNETQSETESEAQSEPQSETKSESQSEVRSRMPLPHGTPA